MLMEWSDGVELDSVLQGLGCVGEGERFVGQMALEQMETEHESKRQMAREVVTCQEQKSL